VISTDHGVPVATHVPVITPPGQLRAGDALWGHMARANPQWQTFDPARPVLLILTGAHAYISPALYQREPAVPTWNYSAVHVTADRPAVRALTARGQVPAELAGAGNGAAAS
jgi:predicted FMN-binding regulatory protein PaiB